MKAYLGDSVYVEFDGYGFVLTTENGYVATNSITLEPEVYASLVEFVRRLHLAKLKTADRTGHE